ncbi:hypothetical protein BDY24DRAFT_135921 [Mrakia frigida]|uniref:uncharacterized protein n=1 Tax=Mrakia frigida TaxID=29902 RepID=UPI003FCC09AB
MTTAGEDVRVVADGTRGEKSEVESVDERARRRVRRVVWRSAEGELAHRSCMHLRSRKNMPLVSIESTSRIETARDSNPKRLTSDTPNRPSPQPASRPSPSPRPPSTRSLHPHSHCKVPPTSSSPLPSSPPLPKPSSSPPLPSVASTTLSLHPSLPCPPPPPPSASSIAPAPSSVDRPPSSPPPHLDTTQPASSSSARTRTSSDRQRLLRPLPAQEGATPSSRVELIQWIRR